MTMVIPGGMRTHFFDGRDEQYKPPPDAKLSDPADVARAIVKQAPAARGLRAARGGGGAVDGAVLAMTPGRARPGAPCARARRPVRSCRGAARDPPALGHGGHRSRRGPGAGCAHGCPRHRRPRRADRRPDDPTVGRPAPDVAVNLHGMGPQSHRALAQLLPREHGRIPLRTGGIRRWPRVGG